MFGVNHNFCFMITGDGCFGVFESLADLHPLAHVSNVGFDLVLVLFECHSVHVGSKNDSCDTYEHKDAKESIAKFWFCVLKF